MKPTIPSKLSTILGGLTVALLLVASAARAQIGRGGPICMIKGYGRDNGSLVCTRDTSRDLINNLFNGQSVRVNIVHDTGAHKITVYINGAQQWTGADAGTSYTGSYNFKYGLYG